MPGWSRHDRSAVDPRPLADQRGLRRRDRAAQHRRPGAARRAVGLSPVLDRRASLRRRGQLVARGADRPDRRRHRPDSRRRGRGPNGPHHRLGGRRKLRHARRVLSRPHRPRCRPVRSAAPRGGQEDVEAKTQAAKGMARGRRRGGSAAVRHALDHHRSAAGPDVDPAAARGGITGLRRPGPTTFSPCWTAVTE